MPTYDYMCAECGEEFTIAHKISETPEYRCSNEVFVETHIKPTWIECGGKLIRQISAGQGFILKGKGWYSDGY